MAIEDQVQGGEIKEHDSMVSYQSDSSQDHESIDGVESFDKSYEDSSQEHESNTEHDIDERNETNADQGSSLVIANEDSTVPISTPVKRNNLDRVLEPADTSGVNHEDSVSSNFYYSPNGTRYRTPSVPSDIKPKLNSKFDSWEKAYAFYEAYAEQAGFSTNLVFGDVIAFDATYDTNLYKMVFVPFTGFLEAHDGQQPMLILTDQDPAIKKAARSVLDKTTHRLCTWHITQRLPLKVYGDLLKNTKLRAEFHKLVWNVDIKPETFEERWKLLLERYNLQDHEWLGKM
ncbi:hypothetical protein SSX86_030139 [Deinandra increscens subsp. villosa]|uniref:MULE transposase domain-containing protein n=1 Tax=Deinandra increscens subsp. villosa TaxID=3103831 RepID=A0AAP0GN33_9ASTR